MRILLYTILFCFFFLQASYALDDIQSRRINPEEAALSITNGYYAVIIGIDNYESEDISDLNYAEERALSLRDTLINKCGYPMAHIQLFLDGVDDPEFAQVANLENLTEMLDLLADDTLYPEADTICFFFIGQGSRELGENHLFPIDGSPDLRSTDSRNMKMVWLMKKLDESCFAQQILFIDAAGNYIVERGGMSFRGQTFNKTLNKMKGIMNTMPLQDEDSERFSNQGQFTEFLIKGLNGDAADSAGIITFFDLQMYIFTEMKKLSKENPDDSLSMPSAFGKGNMRTPVAVISSPESESEVQQE